MTEANPQLAYLRDQRLAAHALSPAPVWLWGTDAEHILWANPAGAAIFDAASPGEASALHFKTTIRHRLKSRASSRRFLGPIHHGSNACAVSARRWVVC
jgi:hypothetical protein